MIVPPHLPLAALPTPLQHRPDLGAELGRKAFWVKRDDLTGYSWGGNKVRTIEYLLGDAKAQSCDMVVLCGGPTSNFAALMTAACTAHGLETVQVSYGTEPNPKPAALAAGEAAGATIRYTGSVDRSTMEDAADALADLLRAQGRRPYPVPRGGATVIGALGYAHAAGEVRRQLRLAGIDALTLVIPVGSGGSIAGLLAGFLFDFEGDDKESPLDVELIGVSVSRPPEALRDEIDAKARGCGERRLRLANVRCRWELVDGRGAGFNRYDADDAVFVDELMRRSGLLIDTTYNGKALRWLRDLLPQTDRSILYWHTGGALAVADRLGSPPPSFALSSGDQMTMLAAGEKRAAPRVEGPSADGPAPELIEAGFGWEIADAGVLHHGLNIADFAHVLDLHHRAIISDDVARELLSVLLEAHRRDASDFPYDPHHGEAYNSRERFFAERIGDCAGWLHAGRPRREAARVAFRIVLRRLTAELLKSGASFAEAACAVADRHRESFMADQTYLQQAQPSTFGHYLLGFVPPALRDGERLLSALHAVNRSPGGAGCVNGSHLLADRGYLALLLGFEAVIEHTRDAMWQVDTFIDILSTGVSLLSNQSKLAEDLEIWSSQEFNYVDLAGPYTRSSVLMPQKRNPYALTIIRGGGGMLIGRLSGFLAVVKTPSARSDNLIFAYGELPRALDYAVKISNLSCGVVKTLTVNEDRLWKTLEAGFSQATDLAEYVMLECGIDYRSAYKIVGQAVREASAAGRRGVDIDAEGIRRAAQQVAGLDLALDPGKLAAALDPRQIVASRSAQGGAAPAVVADMAARFAQSAIELGRQASTQLAHFDEVEQQLLQRVETLING